MDTILTYPWQEAVLDAFVELQPETQRQKIDVAERAIRERLRSLPEAEVHERLCLHDALTILHVVFSSPESGEKPKAAGKNKAA
jgi:hypothetical protein